MERFNPSTLAAYQRCEFLYFIQRELALDVPKNTLSSNIVTGLYLHAAMAAFDQGAFVDHKLDTGWKPALEAEDRALREAPNYNPKQSFLFDYLKGEIPFMMGGGQYYAADGKRYEPELSHIGGYMDWRREIQGRLGWEIVSLEQRYNADFNGLILAPKPDGVIRSRKKDLWVLERKSTQSEDVNFEKRYRLDLQTTIEVLAVERYYNEPVMGVYLVPVKYTRKKSKKWPIESMPQPLHRVTFEEPREIFKPDKVRKQTELWLNQFVEHKLPWHRAQKLWQQNFKSCMFGRFDCRMFELCHGSLDLADMVPARYDDLSDALYRIERD